MTLHEMRHADQTAIRIEMIATMRRSDARKALKAHCYRLAALMLPIALLWLLGTTLAVIALYGPKALYFTLGFTVAGLVLVIAAWYRYSNGHERWPSGLRKEKTCCNTH